MAITRKLMIRALMLGAASLPLALTLATPAGAQTTTSTLRGKVTDSSGTAVPNAVVTALNEGTNQRMTATTGPDGSYALTGLRAAPYKISVNIGGATVERRVVMEVGQSATLDLGPDAPVAAGGDATGAGAEVVVVGTRLAETKTSEVATNVSRQQIENLPQNNRNFLNFAALAPGVRVANNETRRTFAGGGIGANPDGESTSSPQVNVFIDGVSLKSNIQQGGIVGQDASRGNPFSQLAIQEFRVLTSNFKAEYEDAGTSIITAVTKSGTNDFHGQAFVNYQDERLISKDFFQRRDNRDKVDLKRKQFGAALGGPIIQDKLFFFVNYEGNLQDRSVNVIPGGDAARQAQVPFDVQEFADTFASPFREHLGFAKLNWQIAENQELELSGSVRKESDLRDFGGENTIDRATDIQNDTKTLKLRHQFDANSFSNEAMIDYLRADLQFGSGAGDTFGRNFFGVIRVGGRSGFQKIRQEGLTFRDVVTLKTFDWHGDHLIKFGAKLSLQKYDILNAQNSNPEFNFDIRTDDNIDFTQPFEVNFGGGDPQISAKTTQVGLFAQDDWAVNDHLLLNIGLRWDYDSNSKNNDFVTPQRAADALRQLALDPRTPSFFDVEDYISTGDNRKADLNQFQPRIGFSYDLNADQRTVFFAGYGRYYDRALFRNAAEETLLTQFRRGNIQFSQDGLPRNNQPTIQFNPAYLTPEGFQALLDSLAADPTSPGTSELRLIPNDLKAPRTDQFSVGVRQRLGVFRTSLTYNYILGTNQLGYAVLNRTEGFAANGFRDSIPLINGYSNAVAAFNTRKSRYHGVYVTVDKPYTRESGWGGGIAYTYARSKSRGLDEFNFDFPNIADQPFVPNFGDERHHAVINGLVDLPWDSKLSGLVTYGSGVPFRVADARLGFGPRDVPLLGNVGDIPHFLQIDLRLQKDFKLFNNGNGEHVFTLSAEVFNLLNRDNFGGADGFIARLPEINANFGNPNNLSGPPRSFQFGAAYRF
jgi:outer membrane receptor protein involved in Fe transport